jgi:hypothetical protein
VISKGSLLGFDAGKLTFQLDGKEETQGTMTETQTLIHRLFSVELTASIFHTQQSVLKLLEASDKEFKEAMSTLVDLTLWEACEGEAKEKEKAERELMHSSIGGEKTLKTALASSQKEVNALQVRYPSDLECLEFRGVLRCVDMLM